MDTSDYDFDESLGVWLTVTTQAYHRRVEECLIPQGITFRQAQVIGWLMMTGELAQSELARRMQVEPSTVVRLLDRMEDAGLIERITDQEDRRRHFVRLTRAAAPVWKPIAAVGQQVRQEAARGLTVDEQATLKHLLRRVAANLQATITPAERRVKKKVAMNE